VTIGSIESGLVLSVWVQVIMGFFRYLVN